MKTTIKLKAIALSVMIMAGMFMPTSASAQSDGFFRTEDNFNENRDSGTTWEITNNSFQDAPLGSGLLILTAVGAGYVALKKKEERQ